MSLIHSPSQNHGFICCAERGVYGGSHGILTVRKPVTHSYSGLQGEGRAAAPKTSKKEQKKTYHVFFISMMLLNRQALEDLVGTHLKGLCLIMHILKIPCKSCKCKTCWSWQSKGLELTHLAVDLAFPTEPSYFQIGCLDHKPLWLFSRWVSR